MNIILLERKDYVQHEKVVRISGRRFEHIKEVLSPEKGDRLRCGDINGLMGDGQVLKIGKRNIEMEVSLFQEPPKKIPVTIILALPRPKYLKRILQSVTSMGVEKIYLINSAKVEKSYWQSPALKEHIIREQLLLGLEQAKDTVIPFFKKCRSFKFFLEDEFPEIIEGSKAFLAHPEAMTSCPRDVEHPITLAIGPEGGFIKREVDKLSEKGFIPVKMGRRILKTETAVTAFIAKTMNI